MPADSRLARLLAVAGLRRVELAARAGCSLDTLDRIAAGDLWGMKLGTLARVAHALGLSPAELAPILATRPRPPAGIEPPEIN